METIEIFGVKIHNIRFDEAIKELENFLKGNELKAVYTPNPEIVMGAKDNSNLRELINKGDLVTADGIGLIYASKIKGKPICERVTGYDLSIRLLEIANENNYKIYFLGGKDGVAKSAAERVKNTYPNIEIAGYHHGYFKGSHTGDDDSQDEIKIVEDINSSNPDIIFVGLGFPKQEIWIDKNRHRIKGKVILGIGGVLDILAGNLKMTPEIFRKLGVEWLHRLIRQPSRIKRQIVIPKFMLKVLFSKNAVK
ncbi:WecB/TagA/CpsF family glycosyltransferase [Tissierella sp.]|uniref:WecB/TagA/CpsF family glycosyltransferase n=1 Tax=Tissierella sp. TaxID=41274 RepID=UPI00285FFCDB|nr:WecB/TagA/CpsF family glycosyltransferase [Tissierella sp.]MDR7856565.1 WecB/TagA/CpsF family glycosyltransferase [Tissierella sp.]